MPLPCEGTIYCDCKLRRTSARREAWRQVVLAKGGFPIESALASHTHRLTAEGVEEKPACLYENDEPNAETK